MAKLFDVLLEKTFCLLIKILSAGWLSGNAFCTGAGGLKMKSRAGQIGHSVVSVARSQLHRDGLHKLVTRFGSILRIY